MEELKEAIETIEPINAYDPNKKYGWTPNDQFVMSGQEFGIVLNALRAVLNTQEASKILLANEANKAVEAILAKGVETGMVKEIQE